MSGCWGKPFIFLNASGKKFVRLGHNTVCAKK